MIITLTGDNDHSRKAELEQLVATFVQEHGDMAVERYDGEETDAARMHESVASMPFLSTRKMVILRSPSKQKAFADAIKDVLNDMSDATDLVIYEPKIDKRSAYYKTLKKDTDYREHTVLDIAGLANWAMAYVKEQGGTLASGDARFLIDRIGINQQLLKSELDKLLSYSDQVSRESVLLLTEPTPQSTVFELLDAAFSGNTKRAFELYAEQRALKVEPQAIIAMLAWQLHTVALVKAAGTIPADQIAKEAKLNPFVVRKTQGIARKLSLDSIKGLVADLLRLDMQLKRSSIDADEATQLYLLQLAPHI
jgi:DNA polymerase-3 subunit delta